MPNCMGSNFGDETPSSVMDFVEILSIDVQFGSFEGFRMSNC